MLAAEGKGLRVLLTNLTLAGRSGTEVLVRNLALGLLRAGHRPMVYSPRLGPAADDLRRASIVDELRRASIPVTHDIDSIAEPPDVIHGHHVLQTAIAAARFPAVPAIFVCHDFIAWHDVPPRLPNLRAYVAISEAFRERLIIEQGVLPSDASIILNAVDIQRFQPGPPPSATPRRALAFAKNHGHIEAIREACALRGITVDAVGLAAGGNVDAPELLMPHYDLVFASAMTAIEAMACLRPVVVCDGRGMAGLATSARYEGWRRENFGLRLFSRPVTLETVLAELDLYDAEDAIAVGRRIRDEAHVEGWVGQYVALYRKVISAFSPAEPADFARAVALHMQAWNPELDIGGWTGERARLLGEIDRLSTGVEETALGKAIGTGHAACLALSGFHPWEKWGVWSAHRRCGVRFRPARGTRPSRLTLEYCPFATPSRPDYDVICRLNGGTLGRLSLSNRDGPRPLTRTFEIPEEGHDDMFWLTFETERCVSPLSENLSEDARMLGFGLISIRLD